MMQNMWQNMNYQPARTIFQPHYQPQCQPVSFQNQYKTSFITYQPSYERIKERTVSYQAEEDEEMVEMRKEMEEMQKMLREIELNQQAPLRRCEMCSETSHCATECPLLFGEQQFEDAAEAYAPQTNHYLYQNQTQYPPRQPSYNQHQNQPHYNQTYPTSNSYNLSYSQNLSQNYPYFQPNQPTNFPNQNSSQLPLNQPPNDQMSGAEIAEIEELREEQRQIQKSIQELSDQLKQIATIIQERGKNEHEEAAQKDEIQQQNNEEDLMMLSKEEEESEMDWDSEEEIDLGCKVYTYLSPYTQKYLLEDLREDSEKEDDQPQFKDEGEVDLDQQDELQLEEKEEVAAVKMKELDQECEEAELKKQEELNLQHIEAVKTEEKLHMKKLEAANNFEMKNIELQQQLFEASQQQEKIHNYATRKEEKAADIMEKKNQNKQLPLKIHKLNFQWLKSFFYKHQKWKGS